jgi:hypothetical protein
VDKQLVLLDAPADRWRLDDHTREVGRRGLIDARRALAEAAGRLQTAAERPAA